MPIQFYGASESAADSWSGIETITGQKTFSDTIVGDISSNNTSYFTDICANSIVGDISSNGTSYFTDICANRIYSNPDAGQALIIDSSLIIPDACFNILSDGKVGIGTTNPFYKLSVKNTGGNVLKLEANNHAYMGFFPKGDICGNDRYSWFGYGTEADASSGILSINLERGFTPMLDISGNIRMKKDAFLGLNPLDRFTTDSSYMPHNGLVWRKHSDFQYGQTLQISGYGGIRFFTLGAERLTIKSDGKVGIGTATSKCPLHVHGTGLGATGPNGGDIQTLRLWYGNTGVTDEDVSTFGSITIFGSHNIVAGEHIVAANVSNYSDIRIKANVEDLNITENLNLFRSIKVRKYGYKDTFLRGNLTTPGFIAQEIKELLPNNVNINIVTLPNIYKVAEISGIGNNIITFTDFNTADLLTGDEVTGIIEIKSYPDQFETITTKLKQIIDQNTIEVEDDLSKCMGDMDAEYNLIEGGTKVFVYGQEINDFLTVNKLQLFTIAFAALQEVDRQLQAEKAKTATLEAKTATLEAKTATLEAKTATLEAENTDLRADIELIKEHLGISTEVG